MLKKCKRIVCAGLAGALIVTCTPVGNIVAHAESNIAQVSEATIVDQGTCGENAIWTLYEDGTLIISGTGVMDNAISWNDEINADEINKVIIEEGITGICSYAFYNCSNIVSVTISGSVEYIGAEAFCWCSSLKEVILGNGITSLADNVFYNCDSLESIVIPDGVTSIGYDVFNGCYSLESIVLPESVTKIGYHAFMGCFNLKDVWYAGDDRDSISIDSYNDNLLEANWHYNAVCSDEHNYVSDCDVKCDICGTVRDTDAEHSYDSVFDANCNECDAQREIQPIEKIDIEDVEIIENSDGYYDSENFMYSLNVEVKVTYKDGTEEIGSHGIEIGDEYYSLDTNEWEMQYEEPWKAGNTYQVTGTLLGVSDTFNVTIVETPIESLEFEDVVLYEGLDSDSDGIYSIHPVLSKVVLKDGTNANVDKNGRFEYDGEYYWVEDNSWEIQYEEPWTPGNTYQVTGRLLGATGIVNVTIKENPVKKLQIVEMPNKTEYVVGEQFNLKGATIRLEYSDGNYEDVLIKEDYTRDFSRQVFSEKLDRYGDLGILCGTFDASGQQTVEIELFGKTYDISVDVKENLMQSVSIKENANKQVVITVNNSDDTSYDMTLRDISSWYVEDGVNYTSIVTDKGVFEAVIYENENSFAISFENIDDFIMSNYISKDGWYNAVKTIDQYGTTISNMNEFNLTKLERFNGKVTAENIDDIIFMAIELDDTLYVVGGDYDEEGSYYYEVDGDDIKTAVAKCFGIKNVDLTLSKKYNPQTDKYKETRYIGAGTDMKLTANEISYNNGVWSVKAVYPTDNEVSGKRNLYLELSDDLEIVAFEINSKHNFEWVVDKAENCGETGLKHEECDICHEKSSENTEIPATGKHKYDNSADANCNECGEFRVVTLKGWVNQDGKWYFYENGAMVKGAWREDSKGWVYLGEDGAMKTNAWAKDKTGWCYVGSDGYMVTNTWAKDSKGWCYLNAKGYLTKSDWVKTNGKWYYLDANGYMVANKWQKDSKGWVYLGSDGAMMTNAWCKDSKGWCYVGSDGYLVTNAWAKDSKGWCYLNGSGYLTKNSWVKTNGKWYYLNASGYMVANTSMKIGGKTYKFNASGVCTNK